MKPTQRPSISLVTELSLPLLVSEGGGLVCASVGKSDLSDNFDIKLFMEAPLPSGG